ncbi:hypothetical protein GRP89_08475 [Citrobacter freundii]|nr:hypothetical protein GRP89_08475 [Citrobacter freundii]HCB1505774.1 hypothetical protein [Citrobacter freundii]HCB1516957.1 hypothetical protein [Citrobacter freundii]
MSKTLLEVMESNGIYDVTIPDSGKGCEIQMKSGAVIHCDLAIKPTTLPDGRKGVFEANKAEALEWYMQHHFYEIAAHQAQYEQQMSVYNREIKKVNEQAELLREMGISKYELKHLPRTGKMYIEATMSDGSAQPYYGEYAPHKVEADYIAEFIEYFKDKPELWRKPCEGELSTNAKKIVNDVPSRIIKL